MSYQDDVSFVICTEEGLLEKKSILFAQSLRHFGGTFSKANVYSYQPREGREVSKQTRLAFDKLEVQHHSLNLNKEFSSNGTANKVFAAAHAESNIKSKYLVFADSDQFIFSEPSALILPEQHSIGLRPVFQKMLGTNGKDINYSNIWKKVFEVLEIQDYSYINTPVDDEKIIAYWNSGLITCKRETSVFSLWRETFQKLAKENILPDLYFMDQLSLAGITLAHNLNVYQLPLGYNYPFPLQKRISKRKNRISHRKKIVTGHYFHHLNSFLEELNQVPDEYNSLKLLLENQLRNYSIPSDNIFKKVAKGFYR